jgi:DNA-binding GntR family transcriptional regulator
MKGKILSPVTQESAPLRRKIVAALRQAIEVGALQPGERLVEKDLCRELNVSRTSLREAIRELEAEGLLGVIPSGGVIVARITREEAEIIYRVRGVLEAMVAEQFAESASEEALAHLRDAANTLEQAYYSGDLARILAAKKHFYVTLCRGACNMVVLDLLNQLNSRVNQLRIRSLSRPSRFSTSMDEIRELLTALENHDAVAARMATLRHVANAAAAALAAPDEDAMSNAADRSTLPQSPGESSPNQGSGRARASD